MGIQSAEGEQRTATEETEALRSKQRECETPDAVSALHNAHAGSTARMGRPVRLGTMQRRARSTVSSANLALYCLSSTQPSLPQRPFPQRRQTSKVLIPTKRKTAAGSRSLFRLSAIASAPPSCRPASSSADASLVLPAASECFVWE
jgi:hypothetical protein